jgi:dTDP-4-dehydrorhamnose 3,5-epimerase
MLFKELSLRDAYLIEIDRRSDTRGFFARIFCEEEFAAQGLIPHFAQESISFNSKKGTVRGMHFSAAPHAETKLIRCTAGAIHDVIVDLRRNSDTYLKILHLELSAKERAALYVPAGVAHGFQTLADETEVLYSIDIPYVATSARGVRHNDPAFGIVWPEPITSISERDLQFPDWSS